MLIVEPLTIDLSRVTTNVPENDYPEWSSGTTYNAGDTCIVSAVHKIYASLKNTNTNHYPPDNTTGTDPWWQEVGATNAFRMLDSYVNSTTEYDGTINVTLPFADCDYAALFELDAERVDFSVTVSGEEYWSSSLSLYLETCRDWFDYFYAPLEYKKDVTVRSNVIHLGAMLTVSIVPKTGYTAKCGSIVVGRSKSLGNTLWGVRASILDYSRRSTDAWGRTYLSQGNWAKRVTCTVYVPTASVDVVYRKFAQYRSTPVVWVLDNRDMGSNTYEVLQVYGFFRSFEPVIHGLNYSEYELEIEGMV
jgi:hypothetical protein